MLTAWTSPQLAPKMRAAATPLRETKIVVRGGEPWAGKPHQHAAVVDPSGQAVARVARNGADIGEDDHRQALLDELVHHLGRRAAVGKPGIREWTWRPGEIEGRSEERP